MQHIDDYTDIDAVISQHLSMDTRDLYLLVLGASHHFIDHDDEQLVGRFVDLLVELVPAMSNRTKVKLYEYLFENVRSGRDIAVADKWEELLDLLDDCPIIQDRMEAIDN